MEHATSRWAVRSTSLLAFGFVAGTYVAPLAEAGGMTSAWLLRLAYAPLCHQLPERSMTVLGASQAVCARCAGLYLGGAAALLAVAWLLRMPRRLQPRWLGWALAPTLVDVALATVGLPSLPNGPRLLLAVPAGFVAGLFLAAGVAELFAPAAACRRSVQATSHGALEEVDG